MIIIIKVKEKKITRGMLKIPMTLLSFPRFTVQAKNMLILLETNIACNFQTNQQTTYFQLNHTSLYRSLFLSDRKTVVPSIFVNENIITEIKDKCNYFNIFLLSKLMLKK